MEGDLDQAEQSQQDKQHSDNDNENADDLSDLSGYRLTDLECLALGNALKNAHRCKRVSDTSVINFSFRKRAYFIQIVFKACSCFKNQYFPINIVVNCILYIVFQ